MQSNCNMIYIYSSCTTFALREPQRLTCLGVKPNLRVKQWQSEKSSSLMQLTGYRCLVHTDRHGFRLREEPTNANVVHRPHFCHTLQVKSSSLSDVYLRTGQPTLYQHSIWEECYCKLPLLLFWGFLCFLFLFFSLVIFGYASLGAQQFVCMAYLYGQNRSVKRAGSRAFIWCDCLWCVCFFSFMESEF